MEILSAYLRNNRKEKDLHRIDIDAAISVLGRRSILPEPESVDLSGLSFSDKSFNYLNLRNTDLSGADLSNVSLIETDISNSRLDGADLTGASLGKTNINCVDLSSIKGLETVKHVNHSYIDYSTLQRTAASLSKKPYNQGIVETFLRGAGVAEHMINYFRSMIGKPIAFYSCFISYSHADKAFARRLHDSLQGRGIRCWLDEHHLLPGDHILDEIDRGIRIWDKVLLCCSKESLNSHWLVREIEKAQKKEERLWKERGRRVLAIIPLNLDGYLFEWQSKNAHLLRSRIAADFTGWERDRVKFEEQFERVVTALRADEGGREEPPESKL